LNNTT